VWTCGAAGELLEFARTDPWLRPFTAIVLLQRLTAELARLRGTDPDTLHGGIEPWRSVMTGLAAVSWPPYRPRLTRTLGVTTRQG
jgi:hypothetical protein